MVGDGFAPLGPPLLPWENRMGRGQTHTHVDGRTSRLPDRIGPVGRFGEIIEPVPVLALHWLKHK